MAELTYSGTLKRSAHFAYRPPVPGVSTDHGPGPDTTIDPDPFSPEPETPGGQAHDVWQPQDVSAQSEMVARPISHWGNLINPLPMNVRAEYVHIAQQERLIHNHSLIDYRPDTSRYYKHAGEGRSIEFIDGGGPQLAGVDGPEFLVAGNNSFDYTNQPNEVYAGDSANVGRYRLGKKVQDFGLYTFWTKQGQDADLRAYTGLHPQTPVDKPRVENSAPYTPNSSGTTTWTMPSFNVPTMFSMPSETSVTDFTVASGDYIGSSDFAEENRL